MTPTAPEDRQQCSLSRQQGMCNVTSAATTKLIVESNCWYHKSADTATDMDGCVSRVCSQRKMRTGHLIHVLLVHR